MHGYPPYPPRPPYPPQRPPPSGLSPLAITLLVIGGVLVLGGGACVVLGGLVLLGAAAESEPHAEPAVVPSVTSPGPVATTTPPVPTTTAEGEGEEEDLADPSASGASGAAPTASATPPKAGGATIYFCNATGWVRVCGFANVCNNQMVSGIGSGSDRYVAQSSAKLACEGMARAKGGSTVCSVTCSAASR